MTPALKHPSGPLLTATGVGRSFGATTALSDVSLHVDRGELLAVLGPNGAGKTTLLKILTGSLRAAQGTVTINGDKLEASDPGWRGAIGVVSYRSGLYGHLTAMENLRFFGRLQGVRDLDSRCDNALESVGLREHAHRPVREFSRGMSQRVSIARATLHDPPVLLFDEPFTGLDAAAAGALERRLVHLKTEGRGVVLVTHRAAAAAALADRLLFLKRGRVAYIGSDFPRDASLESFLAAQAEAGP